MEEGTVKNNFIKVYRSFISDKNLSSNDKIVYQAIQFYYELDQQNKRCFASQKNIAKLCNVSPRTVLRSIKNLHLLKYISISGPVNGETLTIFLEPSTIKQEVNKLPSSHPKIKREIIHLFKGNIWSLHSDPKIAYKIYLRLRSWVVFSQKIKSKYKYCSKCKSSNKIEVHHLSYENIGRETEKDVIVLCRRCHAETHGKEV